MSEYKNIRINIRMINIILYRIINIRINNII